MKRTILVITSIVLIIFIIVSAILAIDIESNLKIRRKLNTFLKPYELISSEPEVVYLSKEMAQLEAHSKELLKEKSENGQTYLNINHLNVGPITSNYDEKNGILSIVGETQHLMIYSDGTVYENAKKIEEMVAIIAIGSDRFVNLTQLNAFESGKELGFYEMTYNQEGNLILLNAYEIYNEVDINTKTWLFDKVQDIENYRVNQYALDFLYNIKNIFSKTEIKKIINKTNAVVYAIDEQTLFVIDEENEFGYINKREDMIFKSKAIKNISIKESSGYRNPIVLTWEAVYSYNPDTTKIPLMNNLNVISPTWYELKNADGEIASKPSETYIKWAHDSGYEIWVLVSNDFDIDMTHEFLADAQARLKFIEFMILEAKKNGYEGINIDFENVYLADRDNLSHFVHEFAIYCNSNNIILSMDVTIMGGSDNWSKCYDHEFLGSIVDFLIIMTYDEHWASSPISGPVASYDWMLYHMEQLVKVVKPEKMIMGVPFYTRVWREYPSSSIANTYVTKSSAIGMEAQNILIEKYELTPIWDDKDKLYYATFFEEDAQVKMWIENAETISAKLEIINKLKLKGVAAWRRGFETQDVWDVFGNLQP